MAQQQHSSEEVDLDSIFTRIRKSFERALVFFYMSIQFLFKNWWIILILITIGVALGYFWNNKNESSKETTLYVQINFKAAPFIYDAVEVLNYKILEKDTVFLRKYGFFKDNSFFLRNIDIEPMVSISDILESIDQDNQNVTTFLEQAQYEDNLLTSEIFIGDYKTHKIQMTGLSKANKKTIQSILAYLNDNDLINKIKLVTVNNTLRKINQNNQNIIYMDSIAKVLGRSENNHNTSSQIYFNSVDNNLNNIHLLFREIDENLKDNKKLEIELLKYNNIVEVLNKPFWKKKKSFFDNKMKILPILFIIIYLFFVALKRVYLRAKTLSESTTVKN